MGTESSEQIPVNLSGSSIFGVYPKISLEKTYNMFVSDNWMVSYPGYQAISQIAPNGEGRGLFRSVRGGFLIAVISNGVWRISQSLGVQFIATIGTFTGDVVIDENLNSQICIVDGLNAYIYTYSGSAIGTLDLQILVNIAASPSDVVTIVPNYVCYHNTFFLFASSPNSPLTNGKSTSQNWYVFIPNPAPVPGAQIICNGIGGTFSIQTKPDDAVAIRRVPGRSNNIIVFGKTVCEIYTQSVNVSSEGIARVYQRVSSFNIDNGCASVSTISTNDEMICWLAQSENNAPAIMTSNGADSKTISTDGIDHLLETITFPDQSTAFFFRQDGHLFYQLTFYNPKDNLSLIYDFDTQQFFHVSDEALNYHPARDVVYFEEKSYFISLNDGYFYQIGDEFTSYNYLDAPETIGDVFVERKEEIPRIRICKTLRKEDSSTFRVGMITFWIEQGVTDFVEGETCEGLLITEFTSQFIISEGGQYMLGEDGICFVDDNRPCVDMSFSKDGNQSFSTAVRRELNSQGNFRNQLRWHRMGQANEFTPQFRFWGFNRFTITNGVAEVF